MIDGNYHQPGASDLVWDARRTTVVWLDLPRLAPMMAAGSSGGRSGRAATARTELWNGNRERWNTLLTADHPIRWAWRTYRERRRRYEELRDPRWVRLRSRRDMRRWLDGVVREDSLPKGHS